MSAVLSNTARLEFMPMDSSDIDAVLAVERRIYAFPWTRGNFIDSLNCGYSTWLLCAGEQLLGYAVMMLVLDEAQLLNISIVPERQHAGFGTALLEHLFAVARSQAATRMLLEVRQSNVSAQAFYSRHGFVRIGERPDYYPFHQGRETALVMERSL